MSGTVRFVNSAPAPKYSIETLPGDSWEVRRTKQVARAILRAKNARSITTEQLAERCNKFLRAEDEIKATTLNGLFAGKRKAISTVELTMFSEVLSVPTVDLIYPLGESVEVRPGVHKTSADALVDDLLSSLRTGGWNFYLLEGSRTYTLLQLVQSARNLVDDTVGVIGAARRLGASNSTVDSKLQQLRWRIRNFKNSHASLLDIDNEMPLDVVTPEVLWALDVDEDSLTGEDGIAFVLSLEHLFEGWSVGEYRLNGGRNGEHQETS